MNRRTAFTRASLGLVGCLSGCLGWGGGDRANEGMRLSLATVDDGPEPLAFEIDVTADRLRAHEVPKLAITVENTGEETVSWAQADSTSGRTPGIVFPSRKTTPDELAIGLKPEIAERLVEHGNCARIEAEIDRTGVPTVTELDPGDELRQRYAVAPREQTLNGDCPSIDTYRAEWEYDDYGIWGFEMSLSHQER